MSYSLIILYFSGETLFSSSIIQFLPFVHQQSRFYNLYGPAEITIVATCHEVRREELSTSISLPIGYPLIGYRIYLLDEYRQAVVPGQQGEIVIGGKLFACFDLYCKKMIKVLVYLVDIMVEKI